MAEERHEKEDLPAPPRPSRASITIYASEAGTYSHSHRPAEPTTLFIVVLYRLQGTHCRDARQKNGDSYPRQLRNGTIGHDKGCRDFYFVEMPDNKGCGTGRRDGDQKTRDNWNDGDLTGTPTKQEYIFPVDTFFFSEKSMITLTVQPGAIAPRRIRERVC